MLEFKLNYYFEKYKESCVLSARIFKDRFKKENGDFELINELVIMIQKYQYKKYGILLASGRQTDRIVKKNYYNHLENCRVYKKFGTREERIKRKLMEERKWKVLLLKEL